MPKFTDEQLKAIETRGCNLLVSAAAGSGKTAVLVERIIRMILKRDNPVDVDRLLIVTFTEAAALEMRHRITKALNEALSREPESVHIKRQLLLLNKASITTIHSFCRSVVKKYFYLTDIDPNFRIADQHEIDIMKNGLLRELFDELYENEDKDLNLRVLGEEGNGSFLDLVEVYGDKVKDDSLIKSILRLHDFAQSNPKPEEWLKSQVNMGNYDCYDFLKKELIATLEATEKAAYEIFELAKQHALEGKVLDVLNSDLIYIRYCRDAAHKGINELYEAVKDSGAFTMFPRVKKKDGYSPELLKIRDKIKDIRDEQVKTVIENIRVKIFFKPPVDLFQDMADIEPVLEALCGITIELSRRFSQEKKSENVADFNDLEHFCIDILLEDDKSTSAAIELSQYYEEIFIDEYQDSSLVQELLLSAISRGDNMFMVGDIKQSIYGFRLANPEIFFNKYELYKSGVGDGKLVTLSKNFRSRNNILKFINFIFAQTMSADLGGSDYTDDAKLYFGAEYYDSDIDCNSVEVITVDSKFEEEKDGDLEDDFLLELSIMESEARITAARIKELLTQGDFYVTGADGIKRPVTLKDIAIILRSPKNYGEVFVKELKLIGIDSFAEASSGYFEAVEVMTALSFLQIIDNPRQDIPLAAVLYSAVYGFSGSELLEIRKAYEKAISFYDAVVFYIQHGSNLDIKNRLQNFHDSLLNWREKVAYTSVSELLWSVLDESGYYYLDGIMPGSNIRQANLTALLEYAAQYEKTSLKGLFHFLRYIERLKKNKSDKGFAKVVSEGTDCVRIMSIHKSKGLEFPVVFVCGLGTKFNLRDTHENILLHNKFGVGIKHCDIEKRVQSNTLKRFAISLKLQRESISEELRILYVALTRAREKLILVGSVNDLNKKISSCKETVFNNTDLKLPQVMLLKNRSFMDFIIQSLMRHEKGFANNIILEQIERPDILITRKGKTSEKFEAQINENKKLLNKLYSINIEEDYSGLKDKIYSRLSYIYPDYSATKIPKKLSITEIKRQFYSEQIKESERFFPEYETLFREPDFIKNSETPSAMAKGIFLHTVMEHLDFNTHRSINDLHKLTDSLIKKGVLKSQDTIFINYEAIEQFLASPLAERLRKSKRVWREQSFLTKISPGEINPDWGTVKNNIMVHGVIDCMFEENEKIILVDYKTDRQISPDLVKSRHQTQMTFYVKAIEKYFGVSVNQVILYFFENGAEIIL